MIGYPTKRKSSNSLSLTTSTAKRGMSLEEDLNMTNQSYRELEVAIVYKKPTPIQVVAVQYPSRNKAKITEAYYRQASTTDFNGVFAGRYIDFEAKETVSKTAFPLSKLHRHQLNHLSSVAKHGGIAFIIIDFKYYQKTYLLLIEQIQQFNQDNDRKSIPYSWIEEHGYLIPASYVYPVDYLAVIKNLI